MATTQWQKALEIPGRVLFSEGNGDLSRLEINTQWSNAEVYLHGAHVTHFQKKNEPPVLFMSQLSHFSEGKAIRGGIPIIFPWFGGRPGDVAHGFARNQEWELREVAQLANGGLCLRLALPDSPAAAKWGKFTANYAITFTKTLAAELTVTNLGEQDLTFEGCLHTYFNIGDVNTVSVTGLQGGEYLDNKENHARKTEQSPEIRITQETDWTFVNTTAPVEIIDPTLKRRIRIEKTGSKSTVVWNPWVEKSQAMADFGDEEFHQMICVESGNVADNKITLAPGGSNNLKIEISTLPL